MGEVLQGGIIIMIRSAGVLMPVTSLPSPYGVGTLGKDARDFIDWLADAGQTYWQMLPLGPTGYGNSPYQALSSYAGSTYLIDLDELIGQGLLTEKEVESVKWFKEKDKVDYGLLYKERNKILKLAADRLPLKHPEEYFRFLENEKDWLRDYAVFMAIKTEMKGEPWQKWPAELRRHDSWETARKAEELAEEVIFWQRVQYFFWQQLMEIKAYAVSRGIKLIGDLPFYIAADSIDVWSHPEAFEMDHNNHMVYVSGFGPDGAHPKGQKWGNPLINWEYQRNTGYRWWIDRVAHMCRVFDVIRIDHFQGYLSYYAVPADDPDASRGHWRRGPGLDAFRKMEEKLGGKQLILEDLGQLTDELKALVKESGQPGMKILQYAFDPNDPGSYYMPFQYEKNSVAYTGTHDNDTLTGWKNAKENKARVERAAEYLGLNKEEGFTWGMLRAVYSCQSDLAIVQMQDLLELGSEARFNDPSGKQPAWTWRAEPGCFNKKISKKLKEKMLLYCRYKWEIKEKQA